MPLAWLTRLAGCAIGHLNIRQPGALAITFIASQTMRQLNHRFTRHSGLTDVLSFHYPQEPIPPLAGQVVGEILIAPAAARRYAKQQQLAYRDELARYVIHGLLHWMGHEDATPAQQRTMRAMEDRLLACCAS